MADIFERKIDDLTIRIDRDLCVGSEHSTDESPTAFRLGVHDVVEFAQPRTRSGRGWYTLPASVPSTSHRGGLRGQPTRSLTT